MYGLKIGCALLSKAIHHASGLQAESLADRRAKIKRIGSPVPPGVSPQCKKGLHFQCIRKTCTCACGHGYV